MTTLNPPATSEETAWAKAEITNMRAGGRGKHSLWRHYVGDVTKAKSVKVGTYGSQSEADFWLGRAPKSSSYFYMIVKEGAA